MKILIIEDEHNAALQLQQMLSSHFEGAIFLPVLESVTSAREYLAGGLMPDLLFLDVNLADGLSFDIFEGLDITVPVIFLTAYDQYAIRAFELNSVDYLLKPLREEKLADAVAKYKKLYSGHGSGTDAGAILKAFAQYRADSSQRKSFLIPYRDRLVPVNVKDIAYLELENTIVYCTLHDKTRYTMEERSIEEAADTLDPTLFYRANRQYLVSRNAIQSMYYTPGGQLCLDLVPPAQVKVLVSRAKTPQFKLWIKQGAK